MARLMRVCALDLSEKPRVVVLGEKCSTGKPDAEKAITGAKPQVTARGHKLGR